MTPRPLAAVVVVTTIWTITICLGRCAAARINPTLATTSTATAAISVSAPAASASVPASAAASARRIC
jgi:hypothetical protein